METTVGNLELTPAEKMMVEIKRKETALELERKQALEVKEKEKELVDTRKRMIDTKVSWEKQNQVAKAFLIELKKESAAVQLIETARDARFELSEYVRDEAGERIKNDDSYGWKTKKWFSETVPYVEMHFEYLGEKIKIENHQVSTSSWHSSSRGFEMMWSADYKSHWYKNAKTVIKKINEHVESKQLQLNEKQEKASNINWLMSEIKIKYLAKDLKIQTVGGYRDYRQHYHEGTECVVAQFVIDEKKSFTVSFSWNKTGTKLTSYIYELKMNGVHEDVLNFLLTQLK